MNAALEFAISLVSVPALFELFPEYVPAHDTEVGRLLAAIYVLSDMLQKGNTELSWLIAEARHKGVSWVDIAGALGGLTRQAAHRRCAPLINERLKDIELGTAR